MSEAQAAQALLDQVATFSQRLLPTLGSTATGSPHGSVLPLRPMGLVLHHTAGGGLPGTLRWMLDPRSGVSAHYVVGRLPQPETAHLCDDLPLVRALPVPVVQMRPLHLRAYHATWANRWAYGIELCNAGELRPTPQGPTPVAGPGIRWSGLARVAGRMFEAYPGGQLQAALALCWSLHQVTPLSPERIVAHDMVQGAQTRVEGALGHDKRDTGPICLHAWRRLMTGQEQPRTGLLSRQVDRVLPPEATDPVWLGSRRPDEGLTLLGYDASAPQSVEMFQVLMGLKSDGVMGPLTSAAVTRRLLDRFLPIPDQTGPHVDSAHPALA